METKKATYKQEQETLKRIEAKLKEPNIKREGKQILMTFREEVAKLIYDGLISRDVIFYCFSTGKMYGNIREESDKNGN